MLSHSGAVEGSTPSGVKYPKSTDWLGWVLLSEALAMEHLQPERLFNFDGILVLNFDHSIRIESQQITQFSGHRYAWPTYAFKI